MRYPNLSLLAQAPALMLAGHLWLALRLIRSGMSPLTATVTALLLCAALVLLVQTKWSRREVGLVFVLTGLALPVSLWCATRLVRPGELPSQVMGLHRITGVTERLGNFQWRVEDSSGRQWLWITRERLHKGDVVELDGTVKPLERSSEGFSPNLYWKARGVDGVITVRSLHFVSSPPSLWQWRSFLR